MIADAFPQRTPSRAWLITLADLALLLVGFFVLLQANRTMPPREIVRGIAAGLGVTPPPIPVAAERADGFAPGSAILATPPVMLIAWARDATRDPRVALRVTGVTDGSAADVDRASNSAALLAADRARAIAALLTRAGVPGERLTIVNADRAAARGRHVIVTLAFVGEEEPSP